MSPINPSQPSSGAIERSIARRIQFVVFFTVFLDLVGFGIVIPLLPLYVRDMHGSAEIVGFILTSFSLMQLLATPVLGRLSDRYGRRPIILLSLVGNAAAMIVFAGATVIGSVPLLFASRILAGATSGNLSACQAAIADTVKGPDRAKAMGMLGAGIGVGIVVGPVLGSTLSAFGPWAPPLGAATLALVDVTLSYFLMPETRPAHGPILPPSEVAQGPDAVANALTAPPPTDSGPLLGERKLAIVLALYFLTFLGMSNLQVALSLFVHDRLGWGVQTAGHLFGLFGVMGLVMQAGLIGPLTRTFGEINVAFVGEIGVGLGLFLIGMSHSAPTLLVGVIVMGAGVGAVNPTLSSLASTYAPEGKQGTVLGFAQSAGGLARTVGPTLSGFLFAYAGPSVPFVSGAGCALIAALLAARLRLLHTADARSKGSDDSTSSNTG